MLEFYEDAMLRLIGRQPNWCAPAVIPAGLDPAQRWPELFVNLPQPEMQAVREACSAIWQTGWAAPDRRDVEDLVAQLRGEIDLGEYRHRMQARYPGVSDYSPPV